MDKWIIRLLLCLLLSEVCWAKDHSIADKQETSEQGVEREMIENLDMLSNLEMLDSDAIWQIVPEEGVKK